MSLCLLFIGFVYTIYKCVCVCVLVWSFGVIFILDDRCYFL